MRQNEYLPELLCHRTSLEFDPRQKQPWKEKKNYVNILRNLLTIQEKFLTSLPQTKSSFLFATLIISSISLKVSPKFRFLAISKKNNEVVER